MLKDIKKEIVIDERENKTENEILKYIADQLQFPGYFGMNFDALNDCLGDVNEPITITIIQNGMNPESEHVRIIGEIAETVSKWNSNITVKHLNSDDIIKRESNTNTSLQAMKERRSIRKFKPDMPSKEDLEQIIEAGLYAASGRNEQAVITIAVTNQELRNKISKDNCKIGGWSESTDPFYGAPVILIVLGRKSRITYVYDGSLVIGNMMLAAHSLGLGSIWIHRAKEEFETEEYQSLLKELGIEGEWEGIGHCAVGYMDCELPDPPARKENRVYWIE